MQQVKSENNNLVGRLTQSDEKTASFKSLLQKLGEQLRKVEKENKDLKLAFQVTYFLYHTIYSQSNPAPLSADANYQNIFMSIQILNPITPSMEIL